MHIFIFIMFTFMDDLFSWKLFFNNYRTQNFNLFFCQFKNNFLNLWKFILLYQRDNDVSVHIHEWFCYYFRCKVTIRVCQLWALLFIFYYTTTAFQTSAVSFVGKTYMHSAGRTTGNGEPESLSLGWNEWGSMPRSLHGTKV